MRALILAVVTIVAVGAASARETPTAAQAAPSPGYTDEWRRNFITGCIEGSNGLQSEVCECSLDREHAAGLPGNRDTIETYRSIVQSCLAASDA
jgi:hypothetical protein